MKIQIKEGSHYRRRDGQIAGPAVKNGSHENKFTFPWRVNGFAYTDDGFYYSDREASCNDLIQEVTVTPVEEKPDYVCGLKRGDKVKVVRRPKNNEQGWDDWVSDMDEMIGQKFVISSVSKHGCSLKHNGSTWVFPAFVLEKVAPGYGYLLNGDPVPPPPQGMEVIPENDPLPDCGMIYQTGSNGKGEWYHFMAKTGGGIAKTRTTTNVRAYARKKKVEPRVGKPGEVWTNGVHVALLSEEGSVGIHPKEEVGTSFLRADQWRKTDFCKCIAPDLETWAKSQWGLGDEERKELRRQLERLQSKLATRDKTIADLKLILGAK